MKTIATINAQFKKQNTMLKNEQIICIGLPTWEGEYMKSTVQLMTELAKDNDVLYVDYPFTMKDLAKGVFSNGKAPVARMLGIEHPLRVLKMENGRSVNVLTLPPVLPTNFIKHEGLYDAFSAIAGWQAKKAIKNAMRLLNFKKTVVINAFNPFLGVHLAGELSEKMLLYYCYDEINAAKWCGRHGGRLEAQLMAKADAVIFSSQPLMDAKKHLTKNPFLVKNGVNFELFSQAIYQPQEVVDFHKGAYKKVVGYLGSIDERLDYQLLKNNIQNNPAHLFVFVGRVNDENGKNILSQFSNVRLVGAQPPADLPKWVKLFDVCLIPFIKNELTAGIYPLKINEYLAAGKPVVTTNFSDLTDFNGVVKIADDEVSFQTALNDSLDLHTPELIHERILFAYENSWEKRASQLGNIIKSYRFQLTASAF